MSKITFSLISIDFNRSIICQIRKSNLFRLNLTQKPSRDSEEYFFNNINHLKNINHEFIINDSFNTIEKLSMTIRSIDKRNISANISNSEYFSIQNKSKYLQGFQNKSNNDIYNYFESKLSLIGCFTINLKDIKRGVNNFIHAEIHSRMNNQIIGYANIKIYISNIPYHITVPHKIEKSNNCSIVNVSII